MPDEVAELIRTLHPHLKRKIKAALQTVIADPRSGKALKDDLAGLRSFRVSRFRIVYRIAGESTLEIFAIGPRERIYEETARVLKKEGVLP